MEIFEVEWMPFAPADRRWWVYAYASGENGEKLAGPNVPTTRLVGKYESLEAVLKIYPNASLSDKTKKAIEEKRV
jgi:hypothetical protein